MKVLTNIWLCKEVIEYSIRLKESQKGMRQATASNNESELNSKKYSKGH